MYSPALRPVLMLVAVLGLAACATRPNPALEGLDGDVDQEPVGDAEVDEGPCGVGSQLCGDACVSLTDERHCGQCDRQCDVSGGCACDEDLATCLNTSDRTCFAGCSVGDLICDGACVQQPDPEHCGGCGVRCEETTSCECRDRGSSGDYACLRRVGGNDEECVEGL